MPLYSDNCKKFIVRIYIYILLLLKYQVNEDNNKNGNIYKPRLQF